MSDIRNTVFPLSVTLLVSIAAPEAIAAATAPENVKDIIASAVRARGLPCKTPKDARRDDEHSAPGKVAWELRCSDARYRVQFKGNEMNEVLPLLGEEGQ